MHGIVPCVACTRTWGPGATLCCRRRMAILRPDAAFRHIKPSPVWTATGTWYKKVPSTFPPHHECGPETRTDQFAPTALPTPACRAKEVPQPVRRARSTLFPTFVSTPVVRRGSRGRCQDALSVKSPHRFVTSLRMPGERGREVQVLVYHASQS